MMALVISTGFVFALAVFVLIFIGLARDGSARILGILTFVTIVWLLWLLTGCRHMPGMLMDGSTPHGVGVMIDKPTTNAP